jgi:WD40 repeat protein
VADVAFSPDGGKIATGSRDGSARVWETGTGRELLRVEHHSSVMGVAFSPNGELIASVSGVARSLGDPIRNPPTLERIAHRLLRPLRLWDSVTGADLLCASSRRPMVGVAFSPDGARVVTASFDKTARIWDVRAASVGPGS